MKPERTKNIELVLGRLRMPNSIIIESLWIINREVLTTDIVESLVNIMPPQTEKDLYENREVDR